MYVEIITPDKKIFEGEVDGVKLPGSAGSFEILDHHAPLISTLDVGEVRIRTAGNTVVHTIDGGVAEMNNNKLIVLVEKIIS